MKHKLILSVLFTTLLLSCSNQPQQSLSTETENKKPTYEELINLKNTIVKEHSFCNTLVHFFDVEQPEFKDSTTYYYYEDRNKDERIFCRITKVETEKNSEWFMLVGNKIKNRVAIPYTELIELKKALLEMDKSEIINNSDGCTNKFESDCGVILTHYNSETYKNYTISFGEDYRNSFETKDEIEKIFDYGIKTIDELK